MGSVSGAVRAETDSEWSMVLHLVGHGRRCTGMLTCDGVAVTNILAEYGVLQ